MRFFTVIALCVAAASAAVVEMPFQASGSLRSRMIKDGSWKQHVQDTWKDRATGSQPFVDYYDDFYMGNIQVGTPAQNFTVVLDTGSSNLWLIDAKCQTAACKGQASSNFVKQRFDTTKSTTYKAESTKFSIQYGSGACDGHNAKDNVNMGGLVIKQQEFGVAETIAEVFGYQPMSGILGLAFQSLAVDNIVPPFMNLLPQLDAGLFTVYMGLDNGIASGRGGKITYGGLDKTNCAAKVNYVKLSSATYWQFALDGVKAGTYTFSKKSQTISDTGTSWLGLPDSMATGIANVIGSTYDWSYELYTIPCSKKGSLPSIDFTIGGIVYSVPDKEYVLDLGLGGGNCAVTMFAMSSISGGSYGPSSILGDSFIRSYCNIYDVTNKQIGFANVIAKN